MSSTKSLCFAATAIAGVLVIAPAARAQEINYGALAQMFGEPVTTSATGSPQKTSQAPADMQIISPDEIRRSGATNIPDILRYYAGIDVRSEDALGSDVSIRGYSQPFNPRLLVLINGRQVYLDDYGYTAWQTLPVQLTDIRQIEVVRGPASALFGFNAASGVINIITYDPLFDKINTLNFGLGTDGTYTGSLVSTLNESGKGGITVQLGGLRTHEFSESKISGVAPPDSTRPYEGSYAVDGRYKPTANTEVTLETTQSVADSAYLGPGYSYVTEAYRIRSYKASVSADTNLGLLTLLAYTNQAKMSYHNLDSPSLFDNNQVDVVQGSDLFKIADAHSIRIGLEFRNNRGSGKLFDGSLHYNDFAASLMWNWQIDPALSFTAAGRLDHLGLERADPLTSADIYTPADYQHAHITTPSYNLGLVWQPTNFDTFRLLTGRAVQAPSLLDFGVDIQNTAGPITVLYGGNPNLKPSTSTNYEADYDRQIPQISSVLRTAVFFSTTQDFMSTPTNLPGTFSGTMLESYSQNIGSGQAMGGEIGLQSSDDALPRWNVSYSLIGVRNKTLYSAPDSPLPLSNDTPTSEVDFGAGYSWYRWEADFAGHWQSNYQTYNLSTGSTGIFFTPVTVKNYFTASARIGYQINSHITLAVAGQQLTQAQMNGIGSLQPQRSVIFSATFTN